MTALNAAHIPYLIMMVRDKYYPKHSFREIRVKFERQFQLLVHSPVSATKLLAEMCEWKQTKSLRELSDLQFAYADSLN